MDRTGTLMIKPNQCSIDPDEINANYPHYNYNQNSDDESEELSFEANSLRSRRIRNWITRRLDWEKICTGC